jgi:hypothetical protein
MHHARRRPYRVAHSYHDLAIGIADDPFACHRDQELACPVRVPVGPCAWREEVVPHRYAITWPHDDIAPDFPVKVSSARAEGVPAPPRTTVIITVFLSACVLRAVRRETA